MPKPAEKECPTCRGSGDRWEWSSWLEQDVRFDCLCTLTPEELVEHRRLASMTIEEFLAEVEKS